MAKKRLKDNPMQCSCKKKENLYSQMVQNWSYWIENGSQNVQKIAKKTSKNNTITC